MKTAVNPVFLDHLNSINLTGDETNFVIVGMLKDPTASSIQFSGGDPDNWLTLPTALIEEATCLGMAKGTDSNAKECFPLFSIALKNPETQSERFFFDLVMPPFFAASAIKRLRKRLH